MRYPHVFALLVVVLAAFFWRPLFLGEVIYPHDNDLELGIAASSETDRISNRKFSDQSSHYIPELHHQLNGHTEAWISTWNPHVELGRPSTQVGGISKAFWLTHGLSWVCKDAFRVYTWLVVFAIGATSIFGLLLFRSEGLHPAASLAGALGIGLGVFTSYWATFAVFVFGLCWTLAWLWLIRRMLKERDPLSALGIVVVVQGLLLTAYPQQVVWHLWFVGIYTIHAAIRSEGGLASSWRALAWIGGASLIGLIAAAPVYLDVAVDAARSARLDTPLDFFLNVLPRVDNLGKALEQMMQIVDASVFGNPIDPRHPIPFDGISLTPLYVFGVATSFLDGGFRRLWPLQLFVGFALLATFSPPIYAFGVEYLGLSLSRFIPAAGALIPIAILSAHGFDAVLRGTPKALSVAVAIVCGLLGLILMTGAAASIPLDPWGVGSAAVVVCLVVAFGASRMPSLLVAIVVVSVFVYAQPLLLVRPAEAIHRDSPLVRQLRAFADEDSRYAWVDRAVIPSNQESLLGLRSIHTYNSLSSLEYQRWVERISEQGTTLHGRHFSAIRGRSKLSSLALGRAGVGLLISPARLDPELARPIARWRRFWLYRPLRPPRLATQTTAWRFEGERRVRLEDSSPESPLTVGRMPIADDRLIFEVTPVDRPSLLWASWQFHPHWRARSGDDLLETVVVDEIYQGVVVPAGVAVVDLSFEPYTRWAWLPQACLLVALPGCLVWQRRRARALLAGSRSRLRVSRPRRNRLSAIVMW
jgi:hypothetical protein